MTVIDKESILKYLSGVSWCHDHHQAAIDCELSAPDQPYKDINKAVLPR